MNKALISIFWILLWLAITGCNRYVCPAYTSAFLLTSAESDKFNSYFSEEDSMPKEDDPKFQGYTKNWNGLVSRGGKYRYGFFRRVLDKFKPKRGKYNFNAPKTVKATPSFGDSSSLESDSTLSIPESGDTDLFATGVNVDSLNIAADSLTNDFSAIQDSAFIADPPFHFDQFYYVMNFMHLLEEDQDSSLLAQIDERSLTKEEKKERKKAEKKEAKEAKKLLKEEKKVAKDSAQQVKEEQELAEDEQSIEDFYREEEAEYFQNQDGEKKKKEKKGGLLKGVMGGLKKKKKKDKQEEGGN